MPIDASIPLQGKRPDMIGRMSELLGIQGQQVGLQQQGEQLKQTKQTTTQRRALADFDMSKIIGDDGTIDLNKIPGSGFREAAGDQYAEQLQQLLGVKQSQIAAKHSLIGLKDVQRQSFGQMMGAIVNDPDVAADSPEGRQKVQQAFGQYANMYGQDVEGVLKAYAAPIQNAPPGKLGQVLKNIQMQATSADSQATRQTPDYKQVNTGSTLERVQTNPNAPGGVDIPQRMQLGISPGEQASTTADQLGNLYVQKRDKAGNITGYEPVQGGPASFGAGERKSIEAQADTNFSNVSANRIAASLAPQQLDQINKALDISSGVTTGGGADWIAKRAKFESIAGAFIPGFKSAADDATKLQMLDKFTERIAADSARVLGANASTDAARESISRQNANTGYTQKAIQEVLQYAKAQTMAMGAKGDAQENWLKKEGNGITKQHEFETAWRQAYDPLIFQVQAMPSSERNDYLNKLPKSQTRDLSAKYEKLRALGAIK